MKIQGGDIRKILLLMLISSQLWAVVAMASSTTAASDTVGLFDRIMGILPNLIPVAVVVGLIGLVGTIYGKRIDKRISEDSSSIRMFESVIKDNATLRVDKDKLQSDYNTKLSDLSTALSTIKMLEHDNSDYLEEIKILEEKYEKSKAINEEYKIKVAKFEIMQTMVAEKLNRLGVPLFEIALLLGIDPDDSSKNGDES